ncbi:galactokinase [Cryptotrichosporon argae]
MTHLSDRLSRIHVIRVPVRVNILGEHIDYSLFPVLPAAIEQNIIVALLPRSVPGVRLVNVLPRFTASEFALAPPADGRGWDAGPVPPKQGGGWENYVKVALLGYRERFVLGSGDGKGMGLLVSGVVPPGAGMSSSAAFVVASVLTVLVANGQTDGISKGDFVGLAMACEHRMGLRTDGMDQAASALCLPNSLVHLSCEHAQGLTDEQVYEKALADLPCVLGRDGRDGRGWTRDEMIEASGMSADAFTRACLDFAPVRATRLHLFKHAQHSVQESLCVARFAAVCRSFGDAPVAQNGDDNGDDARLRELGALMNDAHASIRDLYDATVLVVEELQAVCVKACALGARQTGDGGWGRAVLWRMPVSRTPVFLDCAAAFAIIPGVSAGVYAVGDEGEI